MTKTYVRQIKVRHWFPANDPLAAHIARLCILREDFAIEMSGIHAAEIKTLDGNDVVYRKFYFWRRLVVTLGEIRSALRTLQQLPDFQLIVNEQTCEWRQWFDSSIAELENDRELIKTTRNSLGGHVLHTAMQAALNSMPGENFSYLEVGATAGKTHYRFAAEIAGEMLHRTDAPEPQRQANLHSQFVAIAEHLAVFSLIDTIFKMYVDSRKLLK
jgi:hypothetical protein